MAIKDKTLTIRFAGDTSNLIQATQNVIDVAKSMGVEVSKQIVRLDKDATKFNSSLDIVSNNIEKLRDTADRLNSGKGAKFTDNFERESLRKLNLAKEHDLKRLDSARNTIRLERIIAEQGISSIAAIRERAAQKEQALNAKLQSDLLKIRTEFGKADSNQAFVQQAALRNKLIAQYEASVKRIIRATAEEVEQQKQVVEEERKAVQAAARRERLEESLNRSIAQQAGLQRTNQAAVAATAGTTTSLLDTNKSLLRHIFEIVAGYRLVNAVINQTITTLKNIPQAGIQQQATIAALTGTFGDEDAANNLRLITDLANRYGQQITALEIGYRKFAPSARLAGVEQDVINQTFDDFVAVGTVLHKTGDEMQFIFTALDQIFAKGVAQSEELKRQLGNQLPATIEIAAKAMDKTPAQFFEAMKRNEIIARDFVPKFAALYRAIFAGGDDRVLITLADKLFANYVRILNKYETINRQIFASSEQTLNEGAKRIVGILESISDNMQGIIEVASVMSALLVGRVAVAFGTVALEALLAGNALEKVLDKAELFLLRLTGLSLPVVTAAAGIAVLTAKIAELNGVQVEYGKFAGISAEKVNELMAAYANGSEVAGQALEDLAKFQKGSNQFIVNIQGTQVTLSSFIRATWEETSIALISFFEPVTDFYNKEIDALETRVENFQTFLGKMLDNSKVDVGSAFAFIDAFVAKYESFTFESKESLATRLAASFEAGASAGKEYGESYANAAQSSILDGLDKSSNAFVERIKQNAARANEAAFGEFQKTQAALRQKGVDIAPAVEPLEQEKVTKAGIRAEQDYQNVIINTNIKLLELQGNIREANRLKAQQQFSRDVAILNTQPTDPRAQEALRGIDTLKENLRLESELSILKNNDRLKEQAVDQQRAIVGAQRRSGLISEFDQLRQLDVIREQEKVQLRDKLTTLQQLKAEAEVSNTPSLQIDAAITETSNSLEILETEVGQVASRINSSFENAFTDAFSGFISGSKTASEAMGDFATSILADVARLAANQLFTSLVGSLGGGAGGIGGAIAGLFASSKGNVIANGNIIPFEKGGIPDIGDKLQFFPLANGAVGSIRENGPEAILPLARNSSGELGVKTVNSGSSAGGIGAIVIQQLNVTVQDKEDSTTDEQGKIIGEAIKKQLTTLIDGRIVDAIKPGNSLNPTIKTVNF